MKAKSTKRVYLGQDVIYRGVKGYVLSSSYDKSGDKMCIVVLSVQERKGLSNCVFANVEDLIVDSNDDTSLLVGIKSKVTNKDNGKSGIVINAIKNDNGSIDYGVVVKDNKNNGSYEQWSSVDLVVRYEEAM